MDVPDLNTNVFECSKCMKVFKARGAIIKHIRRCSRRDGSKKKLYRCSVCSKSFGTRSGLSYHVKKSHEENRRFKECQYCAHKFTCDTALHNHILSSHATDASVVEMDAVLNLKRCLFCAAKFSSKSGRFSHMRKYHEEEYNSRRNKLKEQKVFECCFCAKSFAKKSYRKKHENVCMEHYRQNKTPSNTRTEGPGSNTRTETAASFSDRSSRREINTLPLENVDQIAVSTPANTTEDQNIDNDINIVLESDSNVTRTLETLPCTSHNQVDTDTFASVIDNPSTDRSVNAVPESDGNITPTLQRYLRDRPSFMRLGTPDVATPRKARLNLKFGQETVLGCKKKITSLQQEVYRLRAKVKTLNDIICHLEEANEMSSAAADNLKVFAFDFQF